REVLTEPVLGGDRVVVPFRPVLGAEDLDETRRAVVRHFGDAVVAVLGGVRTLPGQLAHPAPPTAGGIEHPAAPAALGTANEARSRWLRARERWISGCVSCDGSSGDASSSCGSQFSSASASFQ